MYTRKLPSGMWQVTAKHAGRTRSATASTKSAAIQKGAELLVELGGSTTDIAPQATVAVVLAEHRARSLDTWSAQYTADFDRMTRRLPADFADRLASSVHPADVDGLYRRLAGEGMSAHRLQRLHGFLSGAFRRAAAVGWVRHSPCTGMAPSVPDAPDLVVPTADEVARIVAAAPPDSARLFLRTAAITGARRGEIVGIQWDDINTERHEVVIRRAISLDSNGGWYVGHGKTGRRGHRVLSMDPLTIDAMVELRAVQRTNATTQRLPSPVWVFSPDAGATPWNPEVGTNTFDAARSAADPAVRSKIRLHDLRHFVATSMLQDGESPIDVANQLGDTVQTVLRTYAHFLPGRGRDAAHRRAALLA